MKCSVLPQVLSENPKPKPMEDEPLRLLSEPPLFLLFCLLVTYEYRSPTNLHPHPTHTTDYKCTEL